MAAGPPPHHTFEIPSSVDSSALTEASSTAFEDQKPESRPDGSYRNDTNASFQFQWSAGSQMDASFHTTEQSAAVKPYVESQRYLFSNDSSSSSHDYQQQSYFPARQESYIPTASNAANCYEQQQRSDYYQATGRYRAAWEPSQQTPATDTVGPTTSKVAVAVDLHQQQQQHLPSPSLHQQPGHNNNESPNQISSSRLLTNMEGNWSAPTNQYSESAEFSLDFLVPPNALPSASDTGILYNTAFDNQNGNTTTYNAANTNTTTITTATTTAATVTTAASLGVTNNNDDNSNHHPSSSSVVSAFAPMSTPITGAPERPKFNIDSSTLKADAAAMRHVQNAAAAMKLRPFIQQYLLHPDPRALGENTVVVMAGKVAQKSYGTEKRFLCPPPTIILDGLAWANNTGNVVDGSLPFQVPKLTVSVSGESVPPQEGQIDWLSVSGTQIGQTGFQSKAGTDDRNWFRNHKNEPLGGGRSVFKQLYINDADEKRRQMECIAKIESSTGTPIGAFTSRAIKVISKPSKKRQNTKNQDFCIHHGATVSLFNRIRSQTVSTKYLGVSSSSGLATKQAFVYPGQTKPESQADFNCSSDSTCFIARTNSWDPFVIWLVDMNWTPDKGQREKNPVAEEYIGAGSSQLMNDVPYPPPPAVALKNKTGQPIPIHYNQHIVLQCLTTGLVSPVMVIRKVDKAATVVGGASSKGADLPDIYAAYGNGGEFGDEILGDPVSQLHKIALQIIQDPTPKRLQQQQPRFDVSFQPPSFPSMPRSSSPVTYLACLNDMVGMHRSAHERRPSTFVPSSALSMSSSSSINASRKRRTSSPVPSYQQQQQQSFMNSLMDCNSNDLHARKKVRSSSVADPTAHQQPRLVRFNYYRHQHSTSLNLSASAWSELGSYWSEDVSDAAVWTIVGTECAKYSFWEIPIEDAAPKKENMFAPTLLRYTRENMETLELYGENFMREMEVWFGDVRSPQTDYRGRERLQCMVPKSQDLMTTAQWDGRSYRVPLLLVRRDVAIVYKTSKVYTFN